MATQGLSHTYSLRHQPPSDRATRRGGATDEARKALGTSTETETIERALDEVIFRGRLLAGIDAMRGAEWVDVLGEDED